MADSSKPRRSWWPRLVRLAIFAALVALLAHYAHTRLTTLPPVAVEDFHNAIPRTWASPPDDATAEVLPIIQVFSNSVMFTPPAAPAGMTWDWSQSGGSPPATLDLMEALAGEWTPGEHPHLQAIITHLESAKTRDQFARLHALRGRPWHFDVWKWLAANGATTGVDFTEMRAAIKVVTADARYQHAHRGDVRAAWEDIKTGLWLSESMPAESLISVLVRVACQALLLDEFGLLTMERDIDAELAAEMDRTIAALAPASDLWLGAVRGEEALLQTIIDATFTRDENGNGWLVLSADARIYNQCSGWMGVTNDNVLWNLASCFYNDRRQVEEKLRRYAVGLRSLVDQPYAEATATLDCLNTTSFQFNPCDGRMLHESGQTSFGRAYAVLVAAETRRNAARVMVALARYRTEHSEYPESLSAFVPAYLSALPTDPFGAPSLGYIRTAPDKFQLYSIGENGQDNGGSAGSGRPGRYNTEDGDFLLVIPRRASHGVPQLVPATSPQGSNTTTESPEGITGE